MKYHQMKARHLILLFFIILGCKDEGMSEIQLKHTQTVNQGLEELIHEKLNNLNRIAAKGESPRLKECLDEAMFYYKNTKYLIEDPDSIVYWRLTNTREATRNNFEPKLDSAIVFGADSLMRKSTSLYNLNNYLNNIYRSFSYCVITAGVLPVRDKQDSSLIHLYGKPYPLSELDLIKEMADLESSPADTLPLWGTLKIKNKPTKSSRDTSFPIF